MSFEALVNLHRIGQLDSVPFSAELLENLSDYDGESITQSVFLECLNQADALLEMACKVLK